MKKNTDVTADSLFASVMDAFPRDRSVAPGHMFGSTGLKVHGKIFAMLVKGRLVVKLPRARVDAFVATGDGEPFDPGHGRLMKEWVAVGVDVRPGWVELAREARRYVASRARAEETGTG